MPNPNSIIGFQLEKETGCRLGSGRQRCAFDDPGFAKLSSYFNLPPTFFTHMVAQRLPN